MKISMICFSSVGYQTGLVIQNGLKELGHAVFLAGKSRYLENSIKESLHEWTECAFRNSDALIFVGACGIAVRHIAPFLKSKKTDPAVLVTDECGKFVISLLSGHLGGANELTEKTAKILHAQPIVTTATDIHQCFAVDVFARKNHCSILQMKAAKEVSAALLAGEKVGFYSEFPWNGELPEGLVFCGDETEKRPEIGIALTIHKSCIPFSVTIQVVPKAVSLGMGCRRGKEKEAVIRAAEECLRRNDLHSCALENIASIDLKKEEKGLQELAGKWNIPFLTFSEEMLEKVPGDFTPSAFVKEITGVENVCERSAVLASENGRILQKKYGENGVTTALALREWEARFE